MEIAYKESSTRALYVYTLISTLQQEKKIKDNKEEEEEAQTQWIAIMDLNT